MATPQQIGKQLGQISRQYYGKDDYTWSRASEEIDKLLDQLNATDEERDYAKEVLIGTNTDTFLGGTQASLEEFYRNLGPDFPTFAQQSFGNLLEEGGRRDLTEEERKIFSPPETEVDSGFNYGDFRKYTDPLNYPGMIGRGLRDYILDPLLGDYYESEIKPEMFEYGQELKADNKADYESIRPRKTFIGKATRSTGESIAPTVLGVGTGLAAGGVGRLASKKVADAAARVVGTGVGLGSSPYLLASEANRSIDANPVWQKFSKDMNDAEKSSLREVLQSANTAAIFDEKFLNEFQMLQMGTALPAGSFFTRVTLDMLAEGAEEGFDDGPIVATIVNQNLQRYLKSINSPLANDPVLETNQWKWVKQNVGETAMNFALGAVGGMPTSVVVSGAESLLTPEGIISPNEPEIRRFTNAILNQLKTLTPEQQAQLLTQDNVQSQLDLLRQKSQNGEQLSKEEETVLRLANSVEEDFELTFDGGKTAEQLSQESQEDTREGTRSSEEIVIDWDTALRDPEATADSILEQAKDKEGVDDSGILRPPSKDIDDTGILASSEAPQQLNLFDETERTLPDPPALAEPTPPPVPEGPAEFEPSFGIDIEARRREKREKEEATMRRIYDELGGEMPELDYGTNLSPIVSRPEAPSPVITSTLKRPVGEYNEEQDLAIAEAEAAVRQTPLNLTEEEDQQIEAELDQIMPSRPLGEETLDDGSTAFFSPINPLARRGTGEVLGDLTQQEMDAETEAQELEADQQLTAEDMQEAADIAAMEKDMANQQDLVQDMDLSLDLDQTQPSEIAKGLKVNPASKKGAQLLNQRVLEVLRNVMLEKFPGAKFVRVVETIEDAVNLPNLTAKNKALLKNNAEKLGIEAVTYTDNEGNPGVILIGSQMETREDKGFFESQLRAAIRRGVKMFHHESLGHVGLKQLMGDQYQDYIQRLYEKRKKQINRWHKNRYPNQYKDAKRAEGDPQKREIDSDSVKTEEWLAQNFTESGVAPSGLLDTVRLFIRNNDTSDAAIRRKYLEVYKMLADGKVPTAKRQVDPASSQGDEGDQTSFTPPNVEVDSDTTATPPKPVGRSQEVIEADIAKLENERTRLNKYKRGKSPTTKNYTDRKIQEVDDQIAALYAEMTDTAEPTTTAEPTQQTPAQTQESAIPDSAGILLSSEVEPQITNAQDRKYLNMVKRGKLDDAQRMVDEQAKARNYDAQGLHGTTHKYTVFDVERTYPDNNLGRGFYFTTSQADAATNYQASTGPDLTIRVGQLADELETFEEMTREEALQTAQQRLVGPENRLIKAFIKFENPAILGSDGQTPQMFTEPYSIYNETDLEGLRDEAIERLTEDEDVPANELDEDDIRQMQMELADEYLYYNEEQHPALEAVQEVISEFDVDQLGMPDLTNLQTELLDGMSYADLDKELRNVFANAMDYDNGQMAGGEAVRRVFEKLGHDGIIDHTVDQKFPNMQGVDESTTHMVAFKPQQVSLADPVTYDDQGNPIPLSQRFDDNHVDMRYSSEAWHGAGKDYDKFSTKYIGTGEGFQAYGWGLYFATKKQIAKWYRDKMKRQNERRQDLNYGIFPFSRSTMSGNMYEGVKRFLDGAKSLYNIPSKAVSKLPSDKIEKLRSYLIDGVNMDIDDLEQQLKKDETHSANLLRLVNAIENLDKDKDIVYKFEEDVFGNISEDPNSPLYGGNLNIEPPEDMAPADVGMIYIKGLAAFELDTAYQGFPDKFLEELDYGQYEQFGVEDDKRKYTLWQDQPDDWITERITDTVTDWMTNTAAYFEKEDIRFKRDNPPESLPKYDPNDANSIATRLIAKRKTDAMAFRRSPNELWFDLLKHVTDKKTQTYIYIESTKEAIENLKEQLTVIENFDHKQLSGGSVDRPTLYKVTLKPEEDEYLLWDKAFAQQSNKVKEGLKMLAEELENNPSSAPGSKSIRWDDNLNEYKKLIGKSGFKFPPSSTIQKDSGQAIYDALQSLMVSAEEASLALLKYGIKGNKFLDGTSRSQGEGSHNYVIFNDEDVEIDARFSSEATLKSFKSSASPLRIISDIQSVLSPDLLKPEYRQQVKENKFCGHCYAASEALYHMLGGIQSNYKPVRAKDSDGVTHWWLQHKETDQILDPTADQYYSQGKEPPYSKGKAGGYLTKLPSFRAFEVIRRVKQKQGLENPNSPTDMLMSSEAPIDGIVTWFSGGGTLEAGLGNVMSLQAVEYSTPIVDHFNKAHGTTYLPQDINSVDPAKVKQLNPQLFHASPVCKNFSKAKTYRGADELDRQSADQIANVIRESKPPVVTIENVPDYSKTALYKIITDALDDSGYTWDLVIHDATDFGAAQSRKRMLVRAVLDGELPALPEKQTGQDWYALIEDLIDDAPDYPFTTRTRDKNWEVERIENMIAKGTLDPEKPIMTMGGAAFGGTAAARNSGGPAATLTATHQRPRIMLPDGRVKKVTPEMMRRLMGLPESYPLPEKYTLAKLILGNGVHGDVSRNLIKPLIKNVMDESPMLMSSEAQTNTPAFRQWFKQSKIVDEQGKPLQVYHGTKQDFDEFKATRYDDGLLFFTRDPKFAASWAMGRDPSEERKAQSDEIRDYEEELYSQMMPKDIIEQMDTPEGMELYDSIKKEMADKVEERFGFRGRFDMQREADVRILPTYLSVQKPFDPTVDYQKVVPILKSMPSMQGILEQGHHKSGNWIVYENKQVVDGLKEMGYDGIYLSENVGGPADTIAVFSPTQVKSVYNRGTWSGDDNRILMSSEAPTTGIQGSPSYEENLSAANTSAQQAEEWKNQNRGKYLQDVSPKLIEIAKDYYAGKVKQKTYLKAVQELDPIIPMDEVPKLRPWSDHANALLSNLLKNNKGLIGLTKQIADGIRVGLRLDINSYKNFGVYTPAVHLGDSKSGPPIGYGKAAMIENVIFGADNIAADAMSVATGRKEKRPFARMNGDWVNREPESIREQAVDIMSNPVGKATYQDKDGNTWTQIGYKPHRYSWFYDKTDGNPVDSAEEVLQVGALVLGKNVVRGQIDNPKYQVGTKTQPDGKPVLFNAESPQRERRIGAAFTDLGQRWNKIWDAKKYLPARDEYEMLKQGTRGKMYRFVEAGVNIGRALGSAKPADQKAIYEYLTTKDADPNLIQNERQRNAAVQAKETIEQIGRELVRLGMLENSVFEARAGEYLPRVYLKHLLSDAHQRVLSTGGSLKPSDLGYLRQRKDIDRLIRETLLGEVKDPSYLAARSILQAGQDVARMDFLRSLMGQHDWVLDEALLTVNYAEILNDVINEQGLDLSQEGLPQAARQSKDRTVTPEFLDAEAKRLRNQIIDRKYAADSETGKLVEGVANKLSMMAEEARANVVDYDAENYQQLPDSSRYGDLRKAYIRKEIYDDLVGNAELFTDTGISRMANWYTSIFKWGATAAYPVVWAGNLMSNSVMMHFAGIPWPRVWDYRVYALNQIIRHKMGKSAPRFQAYADQGMVLSTFAADELDQFQSEMMLRLTPEEREMMVGERTGMERVSAEIKASKPGAMAASSFLYIYDKMGRFYQGQEIMDKLALAMYLEDHGASNLPMISRERRLTPAEAMREANEWLFDYSDVPGWLQKTRRHTLGMPFLTWLYKAAPKLISMFKTKKGQMRAATYYAGYYAMTKMLEADLDEEERDAFYKGLPKYQRDKGLFVIPAPVRDENGKPLALDLTMAAPHAFLINLGMMAWPDGEGDWIDAARSIGVGSHPLLKQFTELIFKKDLYTGKPLYPETDNFFESAEEFATHSAETLLPPLVAPNGLGHKLLEMTAEKFTDDPNLFGPASTLDRRGNPKSTLGSELLKLNPFGGIRPYPVDIRENLMFRRLRIIDQIKDLSKQYTADRQRLKKGKNAAERIKKLTEDFRKKRADLMQQQKELSVKDPTESIPTTMGEAFDRRVERLGELVD